MTDLRTSPRPTCPECGGAGDVKYPGVSDRLFGAPGAWNLRACVDAGCECLWLDPCPLLEDIGKAYDAYYTHGTRRPSAERLIERLWGFLGQSALAGKHHQTVGMMPAPLGAALYKVLGLVPEIRLHLALLLRHLPPPKPGMKLLDVGCGDGLALRVLEQVGWTVQGQDVDAQAVAVARGRGLEVRHGVIQDCGFPAESFDAVTMSHVIEHVHDPAGLLREVHRLLRPGGTLVSVTPNVHSANHERLGASWLSLDPPRHLVIFSANALRKVAGRAGFQHSEISSSVRATQWAEVAARYIQRSGQYRWDDRGVLADRLAGKYHFFAALARKDAERLRGDELILTASK
jgi:2-polyprenyl-3-methyl-5-hydroxy-6-metoxy-1,4-benzoquinol methylase